MLKRKIKSSVIRRLHLENTCLWVPDKSTASLSALKQACSMLCDNYKSREYTMFSSSYRPWDSQACKYYVIKVSCLLECIFLYCCLHLFCCFGLLIHTFCVNYEIMFSVGICVLYSLVKNPVANLGHYFFISWFTDFLAGKTGRSVGKKKKVVEKKLHGNSSKKWCFLRKLHHSYKCTLS